MVVVLNHRWVLASPSRPHAEFAYCILWLADVNLLIDCISLPSVMDSSASAGAGTEQKQEYLALCRRLNLDAENERLGWSLLEKFYEAGHGVRFELCLRLPGSFLFSWSFNSHPLSDPETQAIIDFVFRLADRWISSMAYLGAVSDLHQIRALNLGAVGVYFVVSAFERG